MKEIEKIDASVMFENISKNIDVEADVDSNIKIIKNINVIDMENVANEVIVATFNDGEYNSFYKDLYLSKCIIDYFTNIPVPKDEKGTVDLAACYHLVFGTGGLKLSNSFYVLIDYVNTRVDEKREEYLPMNRLSSTLLDKLTVVSAVLNDFIGNPMALLSLFSDAVEDEDIDTDDIKTIKTTEEIETVKE